MSSEGNFAPVLGGESDSDVRYAQLDGYGNLTASVALRKDTLANLLLVADAADGEIAVATDVDAIVRYFGTPSVGTMFGRTTEVGRLMLSGVYFAAAVGVDTKVLFDGTAKRATSTYLAGLWSNADNWFTAPPLTIASHIEFNIQAPPIAAGGTYRELSLQVDNSAGGDGSSWVDTGIRLVVLCSATVNSSQMMAATHPNTWAGKKLRMVVKNDAAAGLAYVNHRAHIVLHNIPN